MTNATTINRQTLFSLSARQGMLILVCVLSCVGVLIVASASMDMASINYNSPFFFVKRHLIYLSAGAVIGVLVYQIPLFIWQKCGALLLIVSCILLVLVLIPGIGKTVNGSTRWLNLGPINIQVSEIAKVCALIYVAGYLVRRVSEVRENFWGFMKPVLVLSVMALLLLQQPDFGAVVVIMMSVFTMLFLAGVRFSQFSLVVVGSVAIGASIVASSEYRMKRILGYIDPWADQYSTGYQLVQSLIAFGQGGWFGVGLGDSVQKLFYLPEAHTDFVFAILAEEFGFVGNFLVITLFVSLFVVAMTVGRRAEILGKLFNAYLVYGFSFMIGLQALVNVGVSSGLLPTKGLTLPFISYGGSSLIVVCVVMAMIMRADYENQLVSVPAEKIKAPKKANNSVKRSRV